MRLPLKTEYACQVLAQLALTYDKDGVRQVEDLASAEDLSANYSVQILTTLRQAGLVNSRRGKNGGYQLARHPDEISLAEIAIAMEGETLVQSSPGNEGMSAAPVHAAWLRVNEAMLESCREISLTELIASPAEDTGAQDWVI
ncbi:MAG: Rrf2 family transcriptional regulator [Verrucomicrobiales bacterium]|jgi:Rrf2 family protein|nr:Rrf2 family transcriptional regulator [Verrucomicrobiales bacterium]